MQILKNVTLIISIVTVSVAIYHFFIKEIRIPSYALSCYMVGVFLLNGIQLIREGNKGWVGYAFIFTAMLWSVGIVTPFL